jgi:hypothetical protein
VKTCVWKTGSTDAVTGKGVLPTRCVKIGCTGDFDEKVVQFVDSLVKKGHIFERRKVPMLEDKVLECFLEVEK